MKKKLRLLLWEKCNRTCPGCCNKDWDLTNLQVVTDQELQESNEIMLTGGEPMLYTTTLHVAIRHIRKMSDALIYVYTADVSNYKEALTVIAAVDGICVTLHNQADVAPFLLFAEKSSCLRQRSKRVNVFKGVELPSVPPNWICKNDMEWIQNCPLPDGEIFRRATKPLTY